MKPLLTILLALFCLNGIAQNFTLSDSGLKKAEKKAAAEAVMYGKKGFVCKDGGDLKQSLLDFYREANLVDEKKIPKYIWGMGISKASTEDDAYKGAYKDAIDNVPGVMITYFQMWTMASKATEEEKEKVQKAIENAKKAIQKACESQKYDVKVYLVSEKSNAVQVHVRTLADQNNMKEVARKEIMKELQKLTNWDEPKMRALLTFEK
ncbi:hypothetical protein ACE1ET_00030 [Saccharicrinis sp. FJH62]|uniref:hypothetical protein n=1 Tax=Saccharicrinis sp. FJH62 TaxID=3344657 RepID=UPI0035D4896B